MELISIIMSVYNGAAYLADAIDSVCRQTFTDWKLFLIDDGSTDSSPDIADQYAEKDKRIVVFHKENTGLTKALNYGIALADGKYIARLDADDLWNENKLQYQIDFMEKNPNVYICGTAYVEIDEKGEFIRGQRVPLVCEAEEIKKILYKFNPFFHSSVLIRREALCEMDGYNEDFKYAQDYELWVRILSRYDGANLNNILAYRRYTTGMISEKKEKQQRRFAIQVKKNAIKVTGAHKSSYKYLFNDYLIICLPVWFVKIIRCIKYKRIKLHVTW